MAPQSAVVVTTVGPYAGYGMPPVQACAATATHYADPAGRRPHRGAVGTPRAMTFAPTRALLDRVLPAPGTEPSEEVRRKGWFRMVVDATTGDGPRYRATAAGRGDRPEVGGPARIAPAARDLLMQLREARRAPL